MAIHFTLNEVKKGILMTDDSASILPCVRTRDYFSDESPEELRRARVKPIAGDLVKFFCQTTMEGYIIYLNSFDIEILINDKINFEKLALENLQNRANGVSFEVAHGIAFIEGAGDFSSSMILLSEVWINFRALLGDRLAFGVPSRTSLWVVNANDVERVRELRNIVSSDFNKADKPISRDLFLYEGGEISSF